MLGVILDLVFALVVARAIWKLLLGVMEGLSGTPQAPGGVPGRGVQMVRDPVCGTYVVPNNALVITDGGRRQVFFCSPGCRDKYRAKSA